MIKQENPFGVEIRFDPESHTFETDNVNDFVSVTTFISRFFEKFDKEAISKRVADRRGVPVQEILDDWEQKGIEGSQLGNNIHTYCENILLGKKPPKPINDKAKAMMESVDPILKAMKRKYLVKPEMIVFSEELKLAGIIDVFATRKVSMKYFIFDWKTNNDLNKGERFAKPGFGPLRHIKGTTLNKYALQLNMYEFILKHEKYIESYMEVEKGIIHITTDGVKEYSVLNLQREVSDMIKFGLNHYEEPYG